MENNVECVRFQIENNIPLLCEEISERCQEALFQYGVTLKKVENAKPLFLVYFRPILHTTVVSGFLKEKQVTFLFLEDMQKNGEFFAVHSAQEENSYLKYTLVFLSGNNFEG